MNDRRSFRLLWNDQNLERLASLRGESTFETKIHLRNVTRALVPNKLVRLDRLSKLQVTSSGMEGAFAFVKLDNGRVFYSHPSSPLRLQQYWVIQDKISPAIRPAAFGAVMDVADRYLNINLSDIDGLTGGTIIEAGAYIGHKAMRYADAIGPEGHVIAVEIDESNFRIMQRNIEVNGLHNRITAIHAGLWSSPGRFESIANSYQRHTLAQIDKLNRSITRMVDCTTIDSIIEEHALAHVDYINVQVNGAELELLKGCEQHIDRIRQFGINSLYSINGEPVQPLIIEWLEERGFSVNFKNQNQKRIVAVAAAV